MSDAKIRLRAFLGCEEAREIVPKHERGLANPYEWSLVDTWGTKDLMGNVKRLAAKLQPKRVLVGPCPNCAGRNEDRVRTCGLCGGTEIEHHDTPAEQWLLVLAAWAVARECLPEAMLSDQMSLDRALDACEAWLEEPTPERLTPVNRLINGGELSRPDWCWQVLRAVYAWDGAGVQGPCVALQAAAEILGEPRVRELVSAALLEVL